jgi:hypothetical protein
MVTKQSERLRGSGDGMRKAILAFVMVSIVAAAQPAGAIDNGFRGQYRITQTQTGTGNCPVPNPPTHRIEVRYINERVRDYGRAGRYSRRHLEHVSGRWFQWQNDRGLRLRYRPRTDSAVGVREGLQGCHWHGRLIPIG